MNTAVLTLLLLPFVGALFAFVLGKRRKALAFKTAEIVGAALFALTLFLFAVTDGPIDIAATWFTFGGVSLPFGVYIDPLSMVMLLIATGLGLLDIHFAHDYMAEDPDQARYYAKVLFFIGGMILLVSAKEMTGLFAGWEFMGLASYLLISFWHTKSAPADAGVAAFLYTRFGDVFLFAAIGLLFYFAHTLDLERINTLAREGAIDPDAAYVIALFIFAAAIGKSGQFPLFPWLMRAMEGPTTVSALIHGATMVNSGIYIVARLFDFYVAAGALTAVAGVAALSALIGATSALVQREMKKVLAYSTMSHLSLAFLGLGAGSLAAGMTHLVNHAVFKALLFLSAGAVILAAHHTKELGPLGGLGRKMPLVAFFMGIGALSLSGIPPFSGFFSKDAVLASAIVNPETHGLIAALGVIAGVLSIAYIGRLWFLAFAGEPRDKTLYEQVRAPSKFWITLPLGIMALVTLVLGFYQKPLAHYITGEAVTEPHVAGLLPFLLTSLTLLALTVYFFYVRRPDLTAKLGAQPLMRSLHQVLFNGYYVEAMITWFSKTLILGGAAATANWIDRRVIDRTVNGSVPAARGVFGLLRRTRGGKVGGYAGAMIAGGTVIVLLFVIAGGIM